jgi:hypothetical protein
VIEYRAYTVGSDGHFVDFRALVCADDAEAIEKTKRLVDGHDIELWNPAQQEAAIASVGGLFRSLSNLPNEQGPRCERAALLRNSQA